MIKDRHQSDADQWGKPQQHEVACKATVAMPKRPDAVVPANKNPNETEKLMRDFRGSGAVVTDWEIDPARLAIVDSGCRSDTHPIDLALARFPKKIRDLIKAIQFDTAADPIVCEKGATVKYGI